MYIISLILFLCTKLRAEPPETQNTSVVPYNMTLDLWMLYETSHDKEIDVKMQDFSKTMIGLHYFLNNI